MTTTAQVFVRKTSTATNVKAFAATECMEIVHSLRLELGRDFSVSLSPQDFLLRDMGLAPAERVKDNFYKHIVVVGASNMRQTVPTLRVNPNYHGPLKLLNCHGVDGKSWFKKQGPLLALGSDDKVAFTVLPLFFCVYYESYPPSPSSGKKCRNHP